MSDSNDIDMTLDTLTPEQAIKILEPIPEKDFGTGSFYNRTTCKACAAGILSYAIIGSYVPNTNFAALNEYSRLGYSIDMVNDQKLGRYQEETPKQRVLHLLRDLL